MKRLSVVGFIWEWERDHSKRDYSQMEFPDMGSIKEFKKKLGEFKRGIDQYEIPEKFRVYEHIDLYKTALAELKKYFSLKTDIERGMAQQRINHPDDALRNVMKLWAIDKGKLKKK